MAPVKNGEPKRRRRVPRYASLSMAVYVPLMLIPTFLHIVVVDMCDTQLSAALWPFQ